MAILSAKEVKEVVFKVGPLKEPRLDGFPVKFYQHMWHVVGYDIVSIVQDVFKEKLSPRKINKLFYSFHT